MQFLIRPGLHKNEHPVKQYRHTPRRIRSGLFRRGEIASEKSSKHSRVWSSRCLNFSAAFSYSWLTSSVISKYTCSVYSNTLSSVYPSRWMLLRIANPHFKTVTHWMMYNPNKLLPWFEGSIDCLYHRCNQHFKLKWFMTFFWAENCRDFYRFEVVFKF